MRRGRGKHSEKRKRHDEKRNRKEREAKKGEKRKKNFGKERRKDQEIAGEMEDNAASAWKKGDPEV